MKKKSPDDLISDKVLSKSINRIIKRIPRLPRSIRHIQKTMDKLNRMIPAHSMRNHINLENNMLIPNDLRASLKTLSSFAPLALNTIKNDKLLVTNMMKAATGWQDKLILVKGLQQQSLEAKKMLGIHATRISEINKIANASLSHITMSNIGSLLNNSHNIGNSLRSSFLEFTNSYSNLSSLFSKSYKNIILFSPRISEMIAFDYSNEIDLIGSISYEEINSESEGVLEEDNKVQDSFIYYLSKFENNLIPVWDGAVYISNDIDNPDMPRQLAVSIRELVNGVINILAPSKKVRKIFKSPEYYYRNGRIKRTTQILYICRNINSTEFSEFVTADAESLDCFIKLLNSYVHRTGYNMNVYQKNVLLKRAKYFITHLFEISSASYK